MTAKTFCLAGCMLLVLQAGAQFNVRQELQYFYKYIDSLYVTTPTGPCKTSIENYRSGFGQLELLSPGKALAQFHEMNAAFKIRPGAGCTQASAMIRKVDSLLKPRKGTGLTDHDSVDVLQSLGWLRNKAWGYLAIDVQLNGKPDKLIHPSLTILSASPFMLEKNEKDSGKSFRLYMLPDAPFRLMAAAANYLPEQFNPGNIRKDTTIVVSLQNKPVAAKNLATVINQEAGNDTTAKKVIPEDIRSTNNPYKWISLVLGVLLLLLLLVRGYVNARKKKTGAVAASVLPPAAIQNEAPFITPLEQATPQLAESDQSAFLQSENKQSVSKQPKGEQEEVTGNTIAQPYFLSEIMMTAGPRKKTSDQAGNDRDLGEDVCGFVMDTEHVLMWVFDGASDYYSERNPETGREYFSSRLLAQSIAAKLKDQMAAIDAASFAAIIHNIIAAVRIDWLEAIDALPAEEIAALKSSVQEGRCPECAATLLVARLSLSGELEAYRSGDCKLFLYQEESGYLKNVPSSLNKKNNASNDWIFFRVIEAANGSLDIVHNTPLFEIVSETAIQTIVGVSDGVGQETVTSLTSPEPIKRDVLRMDLLQQVQGSGDDKTLCMIEIIKKQDVLLHQ